MSTNEKLTERVQVPMTASEVAKLDKIAADTDRSRAYVARSYITAALLKGAKP